MTPHGLPESLRPEVWLRRPQFEVASPPTFDLSNKPEMYWKDFNC